MWFPNTKSLKPNFGIHIYIYSYILQKKITQKPFN